MSEKFCCMVMRVSINCKACFKKLRRILLDMQDLDSHLIEKKQNRVTVCGTFIPHEVAIKIRKKMRRRVEILGIREMWDDSGINAGENNDQNVHEGEDHNGQIQGPLLQA